VVVVDGSSDDGTAEVVRAYAARDPRVELFLVPKASIPAALNAGLSVARGQWLVRVDAHSTIPPGYVQRAVQHLATGKWGGVGGRKDGVGLTPAGRAIAAAMSSRFGVGGSLYHYGTRARPVDHVPFGAYPTSLVRALGGWDERLAANEDFEFDHRVGQAGRSLLFDPELRIAWYCRQSIRELFEQYRRYGRGKAAVALLHPESLRPRHVAAPTLPMMWVAAAIVAVRRPRMALSLVSPYASALLAASVMAGKTVPDWPGRVRIPSAFLAMHAGWSIGFWEGCLRLGVGASWQSVVTRRGRGAPAAIPNAGGRPDGTSTSAKATS
jgi:succinoglycan biosynthesis protein ExoA